MIANLTLTTVLDMLCNWAVAEVVSDRWPHYVAVLDRDLVAKVRAGQLQSLSPVEWQALAQAILQFRAPLLGELPGMALGWHRGDLAIAELSDVRIVAFAPLVKEAPSRRLGDLPSTLPSERRLQGGPFEVSRMVGARYSWHRRSKARTAWSKGTRGAPRSWRTTELGLSRKGIPIVLGVGEAVFSWTWWV